MDDQAAPEERGPRWAAGVLIAGGVIVLLLILGAASTTVFGWRLGNVTERPSLAECRAQTAEHKPVSVEVAWVWDAQGVGWGCRFDAAAGGSGTSITVYP
ncbi:MAG TPA: hypothetical protein VM840_03605 [Actinomycetota bacterium]|nr:hypothetical protein [Actinomycetota bacterium]